MMTPRDRPNIVLLMGEDTGLHHGCYGHDYAKTPHLDRLASQGTRYTNAFSHAPVCAPSRSGLITGRYPIAIGTHQMRSTLIHPPRLFTHELRDAGYYTCWPTKTDFNFEPPEDFVDSTDDWQGTLAKWPTNRPFFLYRNFEITHESCVWDSTNHMGTNFTQRIAQLPDELRHDPDNAPVPAYLPDTPQTRRDIARYHDNLSLQDMRIGQVLDELDQTGLADNTIVIYLTDHGRGLPREKRWLYDAGIHLPMIVRWPGHLKPGSVVDDLVAWVDLAPTLLSLAGASIPDDYDGQIFLGPDCAAPRQYVYAQRDRIDEAFDRVRAVRSKSYHYIRNDYPNLPWAQRSQYMEREPTLQVMRQRHAQGQLTEAQARFMSPTKPREELYDPATDPDMIHNLAKLPEHHDVLVEMRTELDRFLKHTGDLGAVSEQVLIDRHLVVDCLETYRSWIAPLPKRYRVGPPQTVLPPENSE